MKMSYSSEEYLKTCDKLLSTLTDSDDHLIEPIKSCQELLNRNHIIIKELKTLQGDQSKNTEKLALYSREMTANLHQIVRIFNEYEKITSSMIRK